MIKVAVVIFIYKRSTYLESIISVLRQVKPKEVFVIADGPKEKKDVKIIKSTRDKLVFLIDWPCKVHKNYAKENLGLKNRFSSGISWVFKHVDRAIFIEDDCIPNISFFRFCTELLEQYQDNPRIMTIGGNNFQFGKQKKLYSYYFSRYPHVWGWATWKRTWELYDKDISDWPKKRFTEWIMETNSGFLIAKFWKYIFDRLYSGHIDTWDYQLMYMILKYDGVCIVPSVNLVTNLGYGQDATNIKTDNKTVGVPSECMPFPLNHPTKIIIDHQADHEIENLVYLHPLGKVSLLVKSFLRLI